jgi:hypothetical protein
MARQIKAQNIQAWIKAFGYNDEDEYESHFAFYNKYDSTMWSQLEIVGRLDSPLIEWDENSIPTIKNPEEVQEYLAAKMKRRLKIWREWTDEQIDRKKPQEDAVGLGRNSVKEIGAASDSGKARRGRPRLHKNERGTAPVGG